MITTDHPSSEVRKKRQGKNPLWCPVHGARERIALAPRIGIDFTYYENRLLSGEFDDEDHRWYTSKYGMVQSALFTGAELEDRLPGVFSEHELEEADAAYNYSHPYACPGCAFWDVDPSLHYYYVQPNKQPSVLMPRNWGRASD
jgi:hypothetical protein